MATTDQSFYDFYVDTVGTKRVSFEYFFERSCSATHTLN